MRFHSLLLLFFAAAVQGCTTASPAQRSPADLRLHAVAAKLLASISTDRCISLKIFDSPDLAAYSHGDGRLRFSTTLVARLNDGELAAAVAHELGHLVNDGHVHSTAALSGVTASEDVEIAADRTAADLLRAAGGDRSDLETMLAKVSSDPALSPEARTRIHQRIERLHASR